MTEHFTAFADTIRIASGPLAEVALAVRHAGEGARLLVFSDASGRQIDLDLRGTDAEITARHGADSEPRGRGRPRLGVTAREVTLLPRHWEWLADQPGGASAALRRLIDTARKVPDAQRRAARDAAYRFMAAIGGDLPGFEEAARSLYADDRPGLEARIAAWPADIAGHALHLAFG